MLVPRGNVLPASGQAGPPGTRRVVARGPPLPPLTVSSHPLKAFTVLAVRGEVDIATVGLLRRALTALPDQPGPRIIVDPRACSFCDAARLGILAGAPRRIQESGGDLRLAGATPIVVLALRATGLDRVLPAYRSFAAAASNEGS